MKPSEHTERPNFCTKVTLFAAGLLGALAALAGPQPISIIDIAAQTQLQSIGTLRGKTPAGTWVGGVAVISQSDCFLAVSTAGHNVFDGNGLPTTALSNMSVHIGGDQLKVVDSVTDPVNKSTTAPENDWAILIAAKPKCGTPYRVLDPFQLTQADIPNSGLPVQMVCYHHDNAVLRNRLATEQCRLYPTGQKFDGLYRSKIGQPVGLHSCRVNLGTSGCPLVVDDGSGLKFIGTQIETHIRTGAGVARLFSEAYQQGLSRALSAMDNAENARGQISLASTR